MNVSAIGGYTPISYISPYANAVAGSANASANIAGAQKPAPIENANGILPSCDMSANGKSVEKTDPGYKCQTCANRKYQDGSDENVSFKSATNIAPEAAAAAVRGHEQEHVANAYDKAKQNNGKVISATVQIHTSICPECGKTYVSGGTTRTQIKYSNEENPYQKNLKDLQGGFLRGINLDLGI